MLKLGLNRNGINKVCNRIFDTVNHFFQGSAYQRSTYSDLSLHSEQSSACCQEWNLHQGVSDIFIKDISVTVSWLLPSPFLETLRKIHRNILIYFYADIIEEESGLEPEIRSPLTSGFTSLKAKIIFESDHVRQSINTGIISFQHGWKNFVRKLEIFLRLEQEKETYYLIGTFAPKKYNDHACDLSNVIRDPDQMYFRPSFPFHKRN